MSQTFSWSKKLMRPSSLTFRTGPNRVADIAAVVRAPSMMSPPVLGSCACRRMAPAAIRWPLTSVTVAPSIVALNWLPVEVEVDTPDQLEAALAAKADIVLLDNMTPEQMRQAVEWRDAVSPDTRLEASGGVNLSTVRAIAATGVDRISVGALTHSAPALDIGLDYMLADKE